MGHRTRLIATKNKDLNIVRCVEIRTHNIQNDLRIPFANRDGTRVSDLMSAVLSSMWDSGYPKSGQGNCVAFKRLSLVNVPCDNTLNSYFDFNIDTAFNSTKPFLGYLCETRYQYHQRITSNFLCVFMKLKFKFLRLFH
jgi:hypothetical protein